MQEGNTDVTEQNLNSMDLKKLWDSITSATNMQLIGVPLSLLRYE